MKIFKNYLVYPFVSAGLLALAFLYNIIFALSVSADPVLSYGILFYFLPLLIGMYLVHYGIKNSHRIIIYIGHILNIISSLFITIKIERLVFAWMSDFPGIILLFFSIWPLLLLLISLTIKAFVKTIEFEKQHKIILLISFIGLVANALLVLVLLIVLAVMFDEALVFFALLPVFFVFTSLISVTALPLYTKEVAVINESFSPSLFEEVIKKAKHVKNKNKPSNPEKTNDEDVIDIEIED